MSEPRRPPAGAVLVVLAGATLAALVLAASLGSVPIPFATTWKVLANGLGAGFPREWPPETEVILLTLRLPRAVAAGLVGAALAVAGALFQGLLRNPLADPYVVGTSGGAALGAVVGMLTAAPLGALGFAAVPACAFAGALLATLLVIGLAGTAGRLPVVGVLLAGFVVSSLLAYAVSFLLVVSERLQLQLPQVYTWLLGGVAVTGWGQAAAAAPLVLAGVVGACGLGRSLNAFSLGEEGAARVGIDVERDKRRVLLLGALLTGVAVSLSGLVGFVGLIVPHLVRLLCGPDHRLLLPASALAGAALLILADLGARLVLAPAELPIGILTAFLGGPFFLWLLRRARREYQW